MNYPFFLKGFDRDQEDTLKRVWITQLKHIPPAAIKSAQEKALREFPSHAPTIGEFLALSKNYVRSNYHISGPEPERNIEVAKAAMARLKEIVGVQVSKHAMPPEETLAEKYAKAQKVRKEAKRLLGIKS